MNAITRRAAVVLVLAVAAISAGLATLAQQVNDYRQSADGLTAYLGVMPAAIVKGDRAMHGGAPKGPHEYHVVAAIFDSASGARVSDANVTAKISGLGLSGYETTLEPMKIADTITYGGFTYLPGIDLYTIRLTVRRSGSAQPTVLNFKYDHRRE